MYSYLFYIYVMLHKTFSRRDVKADIDKVRFW